MLWCKVTVDGGDGSAHSSCSLYGDGDPDLSVVEGLAAWHVAAKRRGARLVVTVACDQLVELLDLTGLADSFGLGDTVGLSRQLRGQSEGGEHPLAVEEAVEPRDPTT